MKIEEKTILHKLDKDKSNQFKKACDIPKQLYKGVDPMISLKQKNIVIKKEGVSALRGFVQGV